MISKPNPILLLLIAILTGCASPTPKQKPRLPTVPDYVRVPHPQGQEMTDLNAILLSPMAPSGLRGEFADTCDEDYRALSKLTTSRDDLRDAAIELVTKDPERMHWCFYGKLSRLNENLSDDTTWAAKQKSVLETYDFLSPIAQAYFQVYRDNRYRAWAATYYQKISEWVFFRKLEPTEETQHLLERAQQGNLDHWVPGKLGQKNAVSVFEKYGIGAKSKPSTGSNRAPASVAPKSP